MKQYAIALILAGLVLAGCTQAPPATNNETGNGPGIANPASAYCEEHGGTIRMFDGPNGQTGICEFSDGSACDEWAYYRGTCTQSECKVQCEYVGAKSGWSLVCPNEGQLLEYVDCKNTTADFCGYSTNASCTGDADCATGGCSGQVCEGQDEGTITTCEYTECYNASAYGLECKCIGNQCGWH